MAAKAATLARADRTGMTAPARVVGLWKSGRWRCCSRPSA